MVQLITDWFTANRPLIYFVYGLSFFVLGLSIALQSRQYSRLTLARSLSWLAGFGILHGLNEWGDVFIPIQGEFLRAGIVMILHAIHYIVLALSFTFLFQFGIELFRPFPHRFKWIRYIPMTVFIIWLTFPYFIGFIMLQTFDQWSGFVTSLARYTICVPGSILSAFGLLKQAKTLIEPMDLPAISKTLRIAAVALFAYGIFGGLIVNPSFYFPASIVNADTFTSTLIIPPPIFRTIIGAVLAYSIIRTLEVFNIETERLIRRMEEGQVVAIERERIARDLHDGALQQVYAVGLMAQSLKKKTEGELAGGMDRLVLSINQAIDQLRAFLPQLKPESTTIGLIPALEPVIEDARRAVRVETFWETSAPPELLPDQISHLVAFTSEALSNAIRHSHTDHIEVHMVCNRGKLRLMVKDFGRGLPQSIEEGFGLRNMRDRARLLGAELNFSSEPGKGTTVTLDVPVEGRHAEDPYFNCR